MIERCDRCGGRGSSVWTKRGLRGVLVLCPQHDNQHGYALTADGFAPEAIKDEALADVHSVNA